ncbi:MAG: NnrS family protein [Gammaproteobacteria bacterium]
MIRSVPPLPFLSQPFRPFFLLAALFGGGWMLLWAWFFASGRMPVPGLPSFVIHGHEMLFGYTGAVLAGFVLTAASNWTGRPTCTRASLSFVVLLWAVARIGWLMPERLPWLLLAGVDTAFFLVLAGLLARPIIATANRRNYGFVAIVLAFAALDSAVLAAMARGELVLARHLLTATVDLTTLLMAAMGGRVIPFFTERRLPGASVRRRPRLGHAALALLAALLAVDLAAPGSASAAALELLAGVLLFANLVGWWDRRVLAEPMLWILHLGYAWLPAGLILRAVATLTGAFPDTTAFHAITVGALGCLTLGMLARVALGHTGRPIAADGFITTAFTFMALAAPVRLAAALPMPPALVTTLLSISGVIWTMAFVLYLVRFVPIVIAPRQTA